MAYIQTRRVTVGEMISGSFEPLIGIKRELGIYFGAFLVAGLIADFVSVVQPLIAVLAFFGYFVGQYWLYRAALEHYGVVCDDRFKVFSLFWMAILLAIPLSIGWNFFFIPGILLGAKWVMAPAFLVAEERNLIEAIGDSWSASNNNMWSIAAAYTVLGVIWTVLFVVATGLGDYSSTISGQFTTPMWLSMHVLPVLLLGLSVTAYRALADADTSLIEVFE